jgi:hypothetical protein
MEKPMRIEDPDGVRLKFPQIGHIRKGAPKSAAGVGRDLKDRFRVEFLPGEETSRQAFVDTYGSLEPERIRVVLPFDRLEDNWEDWYEAYTRGRMIARADEKHFIRLVDLKTGRVLVQDGRPFTPHTPGQVLGMLGHSAVRTKRTGRLAVIIPELARFATLTLHTTSIYDRANLTSQLEAVRRVARESRLPLSGIPLVLSRRIAEVTWVKETGESARVKTGLINIEADPAWVREMLAERAIRALPGRRNLELPAYEEETARLPEPVALVEAQEGQYTEVSAPVETPAATTGTPAANPTRPYTPEQVREKIAVLAGSRYVTARVTPEERGRLKRALEACFDGEIDAAALAGKVTRYLVGSETVAEVADAFAAAMLKAWLQPQPGAPLKVNAFAHQEARAIAGL